jgi:hypothetical protein
MADIPDVCPRGLVAAYARGRTVIRNVRISEKRKATGWRP